MPVLYTFWSDLEIHIPNMSKGHYQPLCQRRRKRQRTSLLLFLKLDKTFADMKLHLARCIFAEKFGKYTD